MSHIMIFLRAAYCAVRFIFRLALLFFSAPFFVSLFLFCPAAKIKQFSNIWWKLVPAFVVHKHFFVASSALHTFRLSSSGHKAGLQKGFVALYKALQLVFRLPLCSLSLSPSLLILFFNTVQSNSRRGGTMEPSLRDCDAAAVAAYRHANRSPIWLSNSTIKRWSARD